MSLTGQWQFLESGFEIVIDQSMTIFRKRFQNCHWLVNDNFLWLPKCYAKLSLTSQWHLLEGCSKLSLTDQWQFSVITQLLCETVIDRSMTFLGGCFKIVIDRSMKIFCDYPTVMRNCHWPVNNIFRRLFQNCHWPINDNFLWLHNCYAKLSLTGQWLF